MSPITRLLCTHSRLSAQGPELALSIGIVVDGDYVYWGDCPVADDPNGISHAGRLVDVLAPTLVGQPVAGFRELCALIPALEEGGAGPAGAVTGAVQQALLAAVAASTHRTAAEVLAEAYGLAGPGIGQFQVPLFLEISDFAATAGRVDQMLALKPAGIGYRLTGGRVAEAIGANAEYLQRFVRELADRITTQYAPEMERPAIYLGLNGALGELSGDPRRQIGQVLGHCAGLQAAVGELDLYLEEPFLLDDPFAQPALLRKLKDFCLRSPAFARQPLFIARVSGREPGNASLYSDLQAADGLVFDLAGGHSIDSIMTQLAVHDRVGTRLLISHRYAETSSPRWRTTMVDIAIAASAALLLSFDDGPDSDLLATAGRIAEIKAWLNRERT